MIQLKLLPNKLIVGGAFCDLFDCNVAQKIFRKVIWFYGINTNLWHLSTFLRVLDGIRLKRTDISSGLELLADEVLLLYISFTAHNNSVISTNLQQYTKNWTFYVQFLFNSFSGEG